MLGALRVATTAKQLDLVINLDERIDEIARKAATMSNHDDPEKPSLSPSADVPALVVGDEMRLRQVVTVSSSLRS